MTKAFRGVFDVRSECDSPRSWFILFNCFLIFSLNLGTLNATGTIFVSMKDTFGLSREETSIPINTLVSGQLLFGLFSGAVLQCLNSRKALFLSALLGAVGSTLSYFSIPNYEIPWLTFCMTIRGAGMSVQKPVVTFVVSSHFKKHRSKALFLLYSSVSFSGVTVPLLFEYASNKYGLRGSWLIHATLYIQSMVLCAMTRSNEEHPNSTSNNATRKLNAGSTNNDTNSNIKQLLKIPGFYVLVLILCQILGHYNLCRLTIVDYGTDKNLSAKIVSWLLAISSIAQLFGRVPTAFILDHKIASNEMVLLVALISNGICCSCLPFTSGNVFVATLFFIALTYGVNATAMNPLFPAIGLHLTAYSVGLTHFVLGLVSLLFPKIIGYFRDEMGDYRDLYIGMALTALLPAAVMILSLKFKYFRNARQ